MAWLIYNKKSLQIVEVCGTKKKAKFAVERHDSAKKYTAEKGWRRPHRNGDHQFENMGFPPDFDHSKWLSFKLLSRTEFN